MNKLKYHFLGGLVFLGTIVFGYIGYTAYTNLATQVDGATITKDIWNDVINTLNSIGAKTDGISNNGGNIGIGTSTPLRKLHLAGASGVEQILEQTDAKTDYKKWNFLIAGGNSTTPSSFFLRQLNDATTGGNIPFFINGTTGNIGIGTTNPSSKLDVSGNITATGDGNTGGNIIYRVGPASTDLRIIERISPDSGTQGDYELLTMNRTTGVEYNRTRYAYDGTWYFPKAINQSSDIRLKKDICSIKNGTDIVNKLRGVTFERKDNSSGTGSQYGFIAQEVEKVLPDLVKTDSKGYKSVNYDGVIPVLVKAIQEQNSKLENQQKQIDKLNEKLEKLINYGK